LYNNIFLYVHPLGSVFLQKDRKTGQDGNTHAQTSKLK
jgi:hypothetical protein